VPLATQTGGQGRLYTAWCASTTSTCQHVDLLRPADGRRLVAARAPGAQQVGLAAAPGGRLWLFYAARGAAYATRSNSTVTRFAPAQRLSLPPGAALAGLLGEGSRGPLDLLALVTAGRATTAQHQRVLPSLAITLSTARLRRSRGGSVAVRVLDVTDPVAGAVVRIGARGVRTDALGRATVRVGRGARLGRLRIVASKSGYVRATGIVRVVA
jgi:hypothetical protein